MRQVGHGRPHREVLVQLLERCAQPRAERHAFSVHHGGDIACLGRLISHLWLRQVKTPRYIFRGNDTQQRGARQHGHVAFPRNGNEGPCVLKRILWREVDQVLRLGHDGANLHVPPSWLACAKRHRASVDHAAKHIALREEADNTVARVFDDKAAHASFDHLHRSVGHSILLHYVLELPAVLPVFQNVLRGDWFRRPLRARVTRHHRAPGSAYASAWPGE
mmetsp:Transcript_5292/g.10939  ORF Transcript_5292/g.10939 Transcript_5292/m.10939 type:complete len:220 (+) Transcript_5292:1393-2052(+)